MKVLIGNSPWYRPDYYGVRAGSRWPHFERNDARYYPYPFFMGHAASLLEQDGFEVRILDGVVEKMTEDAFLSRIAAEAPDLVFLEVSTPSWTTDERIIEGVGYSLPDVPIILGGIHAFMYDEVFFASRPEVAATLRGEYEMALLDAARRLRDGRDLAGVLGSVWRSGGNTVVCEKPRPLVADLDSLPWPHRSQLPMGSYIDGLLELPQPSLQMWASRGCPHQCTFCAWPQLMYAPGNYRMRDPEEVVAEMIKDGRDKGFKSVYFDDDVFNVGDRRMKRFVELLAREEWTLPWGIMARADTCSETMYDKMRDAGLEVVKFGVESGDQALIDGCGKRLDLSRVKRAVKACKQLGIRIHLTFMFGLPGETPETARKTIDLALELSPDTVQFSLATPFPGSAFYEKLERSGYLVSKDWSLYDGYSRAVVRTDAMGPGDLEEALRTAYFEWEKNDNRPSRRPRWLKKIRRATGRLFGVR